MAAGSAIPVYFTLGMFVLVGASFYVAYISDKKRNAALQTVAMTMGFSYVERCTDGDLAALGGDIPLFNHGHGKKARRLMTGKLADRPCRILDYQYTTGSGKSAHVHMQTVVMLEQAGERLPDFTLSPENVLHRLAGIFGYQDIDFESYPDFSKHYLLRGKDEAAIRKAFGPDVLALMGGTTGWTVESCNGHLVVYREGRFAEPAQIPSYAAEGLRIAGAFKT
jgi:hypothetical protein